MIFLNVKIAIHFILYCKFNIFDSYKQFDRKKFQNQFDDILNDNIDFFRQHLLFHFGSNLNGITPQKYKNTY